MLSLLPFASALIHRQAHDRHRESMCRSDLVTIHNWDPSDLSGSWYSFSESKNIPYHTGDCAQYFFREVPQPKNFTEGNLVDIEKLLVENSTRLEMMRVFDAGEEIFVRKELVMCPWVEQTVVEHGSNQGMEDSNHE